MTIQSAYALFRENEIGSLAPGKYADLIILSENPLTVEAEELKNIHVLVTMVNGQFEYCLPDQPLLCNGYLNRVPVPLPDTRPSVPVRWLAVISMIVIPFVLVALGKSRRTGMKLLEGISGIVGGALFSITLWLGNVNFTTNIGLLILALVCLLTCMMGMWFLERHTKATRIALVLIGVATIGMGEGFIGVQWFREDGLWLVFAIGVACHMLALIIFGLANLKARLFPRLNWIPLTTSVLALLAPFLLNSVSLWGIEWAPLMFVLIFGIGWLLMGVLLLKTTR